jgi:hypothetical protein
MMANDRFISSDELRLITKAGSSILQVEKLEQLGIPYSLDEYGTPMVEHHAVAEILKIQRTAI